MVTLASIHDSVVLLPEGVLLTGLRDPSPTLAILQDERHVAWIEHNGSPTTAMRARYVTLASLGFVVLPEREPLAPLLRTYLTFHAILRHLNPHFFLGLDGISQPCTLERTAATCLHTLL